MSRFITLCRVLWLSYPSLAERLGSNLHAKYNCLLYLELGVRKTLHNELYHSMVCRSPWYKHKWLRLHGHSLIWRLFVYPAPQLSSKEFVTSHGQYPKLNCTPGQRLDQSRRDATKHASTETDVNCSKSNKWASDFVCSENSEFKLWILYCWSSATI